MTYKSVAARWPYRGSEVTLDEEEADLYLWLYNNLTSGSDSMRSSFAAGWRAA